MPDCPLLPKCIFFNDKMKNMPAMASQYKKMYCQSKFEDCARYNVCNKLGREKVPTDLFPNQKDRAEKLLG